LTMSNKLPRYISSKQKQKNSKFKWILYFKMSSRKKHTFET